MAERSVAHLWTMRLAYIGLALVIVFFHLIPLETVPRRWAPPDLLLAFTLAWVVRRPDFVPVLVIAVVMLMADLLFQRPPGLMALLVVLGCEYLKYRTYTPGESSFAAEWVAVCITIIAITLLNRLVLGLLLVPPPPLGPSLVQMVLTALVYPLVVLVTQLTFGVRKPTPGESGERPA
ncbi:rod shape-determining protein MreD [Pseudooceanicola lipolyticus]|uniref:Rod shape-determining protein MreD n=1 Tax=Pseudooceanicola lipolyticus TaxID=2029104 RepID=A0A2M8IXP4_9RHOB|nr:rod shape-determining protein MreD [Pseudooceanicola lipolyticus]PJE35309.1 rod shape-determining protein MreD [Pseudooceanicola lipolyticus]